MSIHCFPLDILYTILDSTNEYATLNLAHTSKDMKWCLSNVFYKNHFFKFRGDNPNKNNVHKLSCVSSIKQLDDYNNLTHLKFCFFFVEKLVDLPKT